MTDQTPQASGESPTPPEHQHLRVVDTSQLMAGEKAIVIRHDDEFYRLTVTRNGKLLLQK